MILRLNIQKQSTRNRVVKMDDAATAMISESTMNFTDGVDLDTEYAYDANVNMLVDSNKGISYEWDYNNMLRTATRTTLFDYSTYTRTAIGHGYMLSTVSDN